MSSKPRVSYFYDTNIGSYYYGPGHPMKPQRMRMAHSLILSYELFKDMEIYRPHRAIEPELTTFHDVDYVNFLAEISADNYKDFQSQLKRFNVGEATDCPVFDGLYEFQRSCAGASIDAANKLNDQQADVCINWAGGLHHAKRAEASGFCYINDIVLAILELLKYHSRVMYIDIDIHHGDGVEEAFYTTHRVMTVSFHKFGDFFPGTGDITDVGAGPGKYYAVNVPLSDGMDDISFLSMFKPIIAKCVEVYQPGAIVLQCGADSVAGDRLGRFNLSSRGHAECVHFVQSLRIPLLVLGGGGYTIRNVARCWAYETAVILGRQEEVGNTIPDNDFYEYYGPDYRLHLEPQKMPNLNSPEYLEKLRNRILENLSLLDHAPGVQFAFVPPNVFGSDDDDDDEYEQYQVQREGGGRALGAESPGDRAPPSKLMRARNSGELEDAEDRDENISSIS